MNFLIIFETVEGQTGKVAEFVRTRLEAQGHSVRLFNSHDTAEQPDFDGIDKVIMAAPVHERRHPRNFEVLVSSATEHLKSRPVLMISVSLKASFKEGLSEARDYVLEMTMRTGFEPDHVVLAAGAVRERAYDYFESQIVRQVVLDGRDVQLEDGIQEFTDWTALGHDMDEFLNDQ